MPAVPTSGRPATDAPGNRGRQPFQQAAAELAGESPDVILRWAAEEYHPGLAVVSNFGPGTVVIVHHLAEICPDVPVVHIDTGFEFQETADVGRKLEERYGMKLRRIRPQLTVDEQAEQYGPELYGRDPNYCCYMRKVLPLAKALVGYDAWVTGIRSKQTAERGQARVVEWDSRHDKVKVNPLLAWTSEQVWGFIREHDIPYNSLHDQGYASIGCWPCTRPVKDGEEERAGRWSAFGKNECGIHVPCDGNTLSTCKG